LPRAYALGDGAFAIVVGMPDEYVDPSGNTQAFRAFTQSAEPAAERPSKLPWIIGAAVAAVVVVVLAILVALS
jgi:hypothetical protein